MNERVLRHGYGHDAETRRHGETEGSFAYHLRRHRQSYGKHGISQRGLGMIAHVSRTFIDETEDAVKLQDSFEPLLRVAIALRKPVEALVSPARYKAIHDEIEHRRALLGGDATLPPESAVPKSTYCLGVAYRSPYLVTALSDGVTVLELRQHRLVLVKTSFFRMRSIIEREAQSYPVESIVAERNSSTSSHIYTLRLPLRVVSLKEAKRHLCPGVATDRLTNERFYDLLVADHAELGRYVRVLPATGRVAKTERWRTMRLLAATLSLSGAASTPPPPLPTVTGDSIEPRSKRTG